MSDNIKHPSHYTEGRKFEPKDVIRDWGLNFNLGSAVKYVARAGRKDDIVQDLKKAQEFIQFEIDAIEAGRAKGRRCRCTVHPVFEEMQNGKGVNYEVVELKVPNGTPPEDIIKMIIDKVYGGDM